MSKFVTVVKWSAPLSAEELSVLTTYVAKQTVGNGNETTYDGEFARSWIDEKAANDFCAFAKALQKDQKVATLAAIFTV